MEITKMTLSEELQWRGFVNQTTFKNNDQLDGEPLTFYWGVDPSAASMTIGNLAMAMMVMHFIRYGHKAILLVGGATGIIGDPDGKQQERSLKSLDEIAQNKAGLASQYQHIFKDLSFDLVDNYDWFKDINYLDFLRKVGKHFSMTQLLQRDFVQKRIGLGGAGISYAEFSYSLIQGYDFLHLFRTHGVTLQIAGADQWGNSISGVELIRKLESAEAHVWTGPLIMNTTTGKKFGKSETGAVWLDPKMTSPFDFYQFWLNIGDAGVENYLKIYTLLDQSEILDLMNEFRLNPAKRAAQKALAYQVTKIVHGEAEADQAKKTTETLFGGDLTSSTGMPILSVAAGEQSVVSLLTAAGLADSKTQAMRLLRQGGVKINRQKLDVDSFVVSDGDILQVGKRNFVQLVVK